MISRRQFQLGCVLGAAQVSLAAGANDRSEAMGRWPQWGGLTRDFRVVADEKRLSRPPSPLWKQPLGKGQSAIVADDGFVFSQHLSGERETLAKWRLADGAKQWSVDYPISYHAPFEAYDGPHATPLVSGRRLIAVSIDGQIRAIDRSSGDESWRCDLRSTSGMQLPQSGYAASPIEWNGMLIAPTVGKSLPVETERFERPPRDAASKGFPPGALALNIQTGEEAWRTETFRSSHASPIIANIEGQPTAVFHGMFELVGVDPASGRILWRHLLRRAAADNVSFTPIWNADRRQVLICHGYCDYGAQAIEVRRDGSKWRTKTRWTNSQLRIVHTNGVLTQGMLVGTNRSPATLLVGIDVDSGRTVFRSRGYGKSNLLAVGSRVLLLDERGHLVLGGLQNKRWRERWRAEGVLGSDAWSAPSMAATQVLLRDSRQLKVLRFG